MGRFDLAGRVRVRFRVGVVCLVSLSAASASAETSAPGAVEGPSETGGETSPRPIPASVWIAGAAAGGLAVTTAILGFVALDLRSDFNRANQDASQSLAVKTSLRSTALEAEHFATIAGATTLAVAATVVVLYITRPTRDETGAVARGVVELALAGQGLHLSGTF